MRTDEELAQMLNEHVLYEYEMLVYLIGGERHKIQYMHNALVESIALHTRNLLEFFYSETFRPDDVRASDFFLDVGDWQKIRPNMSELLDKARYRVGKEVAHLTYERLRVGLDEKFWPSNEILEEITKLISLFTAKCRQDIFDDRWAPYR